MVFGGLGRLGWNGRFARLDRQFDSCVHRLSTSPKDCLETVRGMKETHADAGAKKRRQRPSRSIVGAILSVHFSEERTRITAHFGSHTVCFPPAHRAADGPAIAAVVRISRTSVFYGAPVMFPTIGRFHGPPSDTKKPRWRGFLA